MFTVANAAVLWGSRWRCCGDRGSGVVGIEVRWDGSIFSREDTLELFQEPSPYYHTPTIRSFLGGGGTPILSCVHLGLVPLRIGTT